MGPVASRQARFIGLGTNEWEGPWMNRQQILSRLARTHPVLYTTGAWSTWDTDKPAWRSASRFGRFERKDGVLLDRSPAWLLRVPGRPALDRLALRAEAWRLKRRIAREGNAPLVAYTFHPRVWPDARALRAPVVVYHAYDLFGLQSGWKESVARLERELIARADLVLGSSETICEQLSAQGAASPVMVPNGVDFDAFAAEASAPEPDDLASIPRPRLGYIGKLSRKVDLALVADLARRRPGWHFVFVGEASRVDPDAREGLALTAGLPNVHFLGFKYYRELPAYTTRMDVNLICHRLEDGLWTRGTFPLKLFEYLAAGPPVVSSNIPSVAAHGGVVRIAESASEWEQAIAAALAGADDQQQRDARRDVARVNTWDHRVAQIEQLLAPILARC